MKEYSWGMWACICLGCIVHTHIGGFRAARLARQATCAAELLWVSISNNQNFTQAIPSLAQVWKVVSNRWTGLWTGSLYWTDGLDYWTYLWTKIVCTTWPPPNQMCWIGSHVWCLAANRLPRILETKDVACSNCGVLCLKDLENLERYAYTTADGASW